MYSGLESNFALKGCDTIIYNTLKELNIIPRITNIVTIESDYYENDFCNICSKDIPKSYGSRYSNKSIKNEKDNKYLEDDEDDDYYEMLCNTCANTDEGKEKIIEENMKLYDPSLECIELIIYTAPDEYHYIEYAQDKNEMMKAYGEKIKAIWLNNPINGVNELSLESDILYGNDPTTNEEIYKNCSFLFDILPYEKRMSNK